MSLRTNGKVTGCLWFYLIAGGAARFEQLSVVPPTVDLPFVVEVDQIHQQFAARGAGETGGVPAQPRARPRSEHCHFSTADVFATLEICRKA